MTEELAGRALDAAVAERVMGWRRMPWKKEKGVLEGEFMWKTPGDEGLYPAELPAYSSTWEGLGLVVEEMERRGFGLTMICHAGDATECEFYRWSDSAKGSGDGATAPEAVARAALKAIGEG